MRARSAFVGIRAVACVALAAVMLWPGALRAEPAAVDDLIAALRLPDLVQIMREEGLAQGANLVAEMDADGDGGADDDMQGGTEGGTDSLSGKPDSGWQSDLQRLYDPERMLDVVRTALADGLSPKQIDALVAFFTSDLGRDLTEGELAARRAFLDPAIEAAARAALDPPEATDARGRAILAFIAANDMIEMNVSGGMTSSLRFYQGLAQGGQLDMTEAEMLEDIWGREDETRSESTAWLRALLALAYRDVPVEGLTRYVDLSLSPAGQALNRALFAGFDIMYADLNYALGLALASRVAGTRL